MATDNNLDAFPKHGIRLKLRGAAMVAVGTSAVIAAGIVGSGVADAATTGPASAAGVPGSTGGARASAAPPHTAAASSYSLVVPKGSPSKYLSPARGTLAPASLAVPTRPSAVGTVESVGSGSFTVQTNSGTVTVKVSSSTTYINGLDSGTYSDLKVGEQVAVVGARSGGVISATRILIGTPPAQNRVAAHGVLATVPASTRSSTTRRSIRISHS